MDPKPTNSFESPDPIVAGKVDAPMIEDRGVVLALPPRLLTAVEARWASMSGPVRLSDFQNTQFDRELQEITITGYVQFGHEVGSVSFYSFGANAEEVGDLFVRMTFREQPEDLLFARGQQIVRIQRLGAFMAFQVFWDDARGDFRTQVVSAMTNMADRVDDFRA